VTVRPILITGEPVLHTPTRPVGDDEFGSPELRALVDDLFETMDAAHGVGLAANQIGVGRRVFVYDCPDPELDGERRRGVVVNPTLETGAVPETMPDENAMTLLLLRLKLTNSQRFRKKPRATLRSTPGQSGRCGNSLHGSQ